MHVGQDDLAPAAARALLGTAAIVGCSTHTVAQVEAALREPMTYMAVGPVFGTRTKDTGYAAVGLELVSTRCTAGGPVRSSPSAASRSRPRPRLAAGAAAVAVISDLLCGGNPAGA